MFSIQIPKDGDWHGAGGEEFLQEILKVSAHHREAGRALVFSIILYSYSDAEFRRAITDENYWSALNEASGHFMTVFVINTPLHNPRSPFEGHRYGNSRAANGALSMLQESFRTDGALTVPCILFFQIEQDRVADGLCIPLTAQTVEGAYREVRELVDSATTSLSQLKPENKDNAREIFNLVAHSVTSRARTDAFIRWANKARSVGAVAKILAQLTGHG